MKSLNQEIRSTLTVDDITINKTAKLPYLNAVIEEGLRMYSPVTMGLRRLVPKGGVSIDGHFVPENVSTSHISTTLTCRYRFLTISMI